jgi:hypothetical protein
MYKLGSAEKKIYYNKKKDKDIKDTDENHSPHLLIS